MRFWFCFRGRTELPCFDLVRTAAERRQRERQWDRILDLEFSPDMGRADRDNFIDVYLDDMPKEEKRSYLDQIDGVSLGSDAFFPFSDNIDRARLSGVKYVAEPGGSVRDDAVIEACDRYGMTMAFTGLRLFHH